MKTTLHPQHFTYIAECSDGTYYVGKTIDLKHRFLQHNGLKSGGGKYTRARRPVILRYYELHTSNSTACRNEAYLKKLTHNQKKELINRFIEQGTRKQVIQQDNPETSHL